MSDYTLWPSILPDQDEPFIDNQYAREELERMDWQDLRSIAAKIESDEISGKSDREDIEAFLEGHPRV